MPKIWHLLKNLHRPIALGKTPQTKKNASHVKRGDVTSYIEWDENKNRLNLKKHRVSFEEAATVFLDPFELTIDDSAHGATEVRFVSIGESFRRRLLIVSYSELGNYIRIITARRATKRERREYEKATYA